MTPAPFFCLTRAAWILYAITWNPESGALRGVEGPHGFDATAPERRAVFAGLKARRARGVDKQAVAILEWTA